jgi:glycosyltransferase involved in cell wall biosynthesis
VILSRTVRQPTSIIHVHDLDTLLAGTWLARRFGARLVYDAHELYPEMVPGTSSLYDGLWRRLEHQLIGRADAVITVNESIARELQRRHRLAQQPTVVMNCAEATPLPAVAREQDRPERIVLLYHGMFNAGRALETLVQAMAYVDDRALLVMRGAGPLLGELQQLAHDCGVAQRIHFAPAVPPDQLLASMAGCSIGVIPTPPLTLNNYLCTPNKLFDYLMGGLAVVATDLPELRRIVIGGGTGLVYAPNDSLGLSKALNILIRDPERVASCRTAARRTALECYNWDIQAGQLRRLYDTFAGQRGAAYGTAPHAP